MRRGSVAAALTAVATGGVMALMLAIAGEGVSSFTAAILALTIPLLIAGVLFGWLSETERLPSFGRAILYWAAAFSVSRLTQQLLVGEGEVKDGVVGFLIFQMIVGMLFAFAFLLLYQHVLVGLQKVLDDPSSDGEEHD